MSKNNSAKSVETGILPLSEGVFASSIAINLGSPVTTG